MKTLAERFWAKVDMSDADGCWNWIGAIGSSGYGWIGYAAGDGGKLKPTQAHRVSFFLANGRWAIPCTLHSCDNRRCIRPDHPHEGTFKQNSREAFDRKRTWQAKVTHCPRGHYYAPGKKKWCQICASARTTFGLKMAELPPVSEWPAEKIPRTPNHLRTHCLNGHEFTPENTLMEQYGARKPYRRCLICRRAAHARQLERERKIA